MIVLNGINLLKEISSIEEEIQKLEELIDKSSLPVDKQLILADIIKNKLM